MIKTPICDLLGIEYPIFQGGMAWIADGKLAAAVSNGGGLGTPGDLARSPLLELKQGEGLPLAD